MIQEHTSILALAPNWLGDAAMATPAFRALKQLHKNAFLTIAGSAAVCALLEESPWADALHPLPVRAGLPVLRREAHSLKNAGRDLIVVFPHSFRSALLARLIGGKERIGYARNGRSFLLTHPVEPYREEGRITPIYMSEEYLNLVAPAGAIGDNAGLELGVSAVLLKETKERLHGTTPLVGIAPGAAFGPSKRWIPEAFAKTADLLFEKRGARCVLITGPNEKDLAQEIRAAAKHPLLEIPRADAGIAGLKAVTASLDLLICNDSGPRHIAVAFHVPVVCIMGSTSPRYTDSPYEKGTVIREPLPCSPCQKAVCPLGHHLCMRLITPERVFSAADALLPSA